MIRVYLIIIFILNTLNGRSILSTLQKQYIIPKSVNLTKLIKCSLHHIFFTKNTVLSIPLTVYYSFIKDIWHFTLIVNR